MNADGAWWVYYNFKVNVTPKVKELFKLSTVRQSGVSHQSGSSLPQEGLEVSSSHQLQQDEPGHGLQTHSNTTHNVLVVELTATQRRGGIEPLLSEQDIKEENRVCFAVTWWLETPWESPAHLAQSKPQEVSGVNEIILRLMPMCRNKYCISLMMFKMKFIISLIQHLSCTHIYKNKVWAFKLLFPQQDWPLQPPAVDSVHQVSPQPDLHTPPRTHRDPDPCEEAHSPVI